MTTADQAASALGNIPGPMMAWLILGAGAAITVAAIGIAALVRRGLKVLDAITDRGDGQGGVPPIARRLAQADAPTQAISMRDVAAVPQLEGITACPGFCDDLTVVGDVKNCTCKRPCGRAWCGRVRSVVPVTWEQERERGWR